MNKPIMMQDYEVETILDKQDVLIWCEENDYVLVKRKKKPLSFETVIAIAEKVCSLGKGDSCIKRRSGQLPFSRYLAITYFYDYAPPMIIARAINVHHTMISYAKKQKLFHKNEFKYMKTWQQEAVRYFINEIELAGGVIKETEIKELGKH